MMAENPYFVYPVPMASSPGKLPESYVTNSYPRVMIQVASQSSPLPHSLLAFFVPR